MAYEGDTITAANPYNSSTGQFGIPSSSSSSSLGSLGNLGPLAYRRRRVTCATIHRERGDAAAVSMARQPAMRPRRRGRAASCSLRDRDFSGQVRRDCRWPRMVN